MYLGCINGFRGFFGIRPFFYREKSNETNNLGTVQLQLPGTEGPAPPEEREEEAFDPQDHWSRQTQTEQSKRKPGFKGCFNTPLEHTPKPLPTGYGGISWLTRGFAWGVLYGCVVIFLDGCLGCFVGIRLLTETENVN